MKRQCECVNSIRKQIIDDYFIENQQKVEGVQVAFDNISNFEDRTKGLKTGQPIKIELAILKKGGGYRYKNINTFMAHEYCPFCGIKYK